MEISYYLFLIVLHMLDKNTKPDSTFRILDKYTMKLICKEDMEDVIKMLENPNVIKFLYFAPNPPEVFHAYFDPIIEDNEKALEEGRWPSNPTYIIRDDNGHFVGEVAIHEVMFLKGNFDVGYQLPECAWGKGIATAACKVVTELGFNVLGAHKLTADCYGGNIGSRRVLEKSGFTIEGTHTKYYKLDTGDFDDKILFGQTKEQFGSQ